MIVRGGYNSAQKYKKAGAKSWKAANFKAVGASLAHLKYIKNRPGEDREKGGREFFDAENDRAEEKPFREEVRDLKTRGPVIHKIMLAPDVTPANSKEFTREVMEELGNQKGQELKWQAVEHRNTDNPHIHVVVFGKDKNGKEVRFSKRDYNKLREHGGRILDRDHPLEREEKRREREARDLEKKKERREQYQEKRQKERQEKKDRGQHLPWFKKKVVREVLEPYQDWKRKQEEKELLPEPGDPDRQDNKKEMSIIAMGRNWTRENTLAELKELDNHLKESYENHIPLDDYKELWSWIGSKENEIGFSKGKKDRDKDPDKFTYEGKEYTKESSRDELEKLNKYLYKNQNDKSKRLPSQDFMKMRNWLEDKDRAYMSEYVESHAEKVFQRDKDKEGSEREGGRMIEPLHQELGANPALGALVKTGKVISMVVGAIRLDDIRDPLAESQQYLMKAYGEVDDLVKEQSVDQRDVTDEEKTLGELDEGIDKVKEQKAERERQEKIKREEAERKKEREYRDGFMGLE